MEVIRSLIHNHTDLFVCINVLEFIMSIAMLILPSKKEWWDYVICFYGGFLFGLIPSFLFFGDIIVALISCILLSTVFLCTYQYFKPKFNIPLGVVIFKMTLILGVTFFSEDYSSNQISFYFVTMLISVLAFCMVSMLYELPSEKQHWVSGLFGIMELSGSILQFYRIDYTYFSKDLVSRRESLSFFLYLLKVDFWIFDYQILFIICFLGLLCFYLIWRKILSDCKKINI